MVYILSRYFLFISCLRSVSASSSLVISLTLDKVHDNYQKTNNDNNDDDDDDDDDNLIIIIIPTIPIIITTTTIIAIIIIIVKDTQQ